jgi:hypothetical protein
MVWSEEVFVGWVREVEENKEDEELFVMETLV